MNPDGGARRRSGRPVRLPDRRAGAPRRSIQALIWRQTLLVVAVYSLLVWMVESTLLAETIPATGLAFAVAFALVQTVVVVLLLAGLISAKLIRTLRERRIHRLLPVVRERLIVHLAGGDARDALRRLAARSPTAVERCAEDFLATISGSELERLSALIADLGLIQRWTRQAQAVRTESRRLALSRLSRLAGERGNGALRDALGDRENSVRIEAARGLLRSEAIGDIERVFHFATTDTLLVRAVLVEDLRVHAVHLSEQAIPRALASAEPDRVQVTLEMMEAWQKSMPVPAVATLLRHPRAEIRARALRVLPYVSGDAGAEGEALAGLADDAIEVQVAAAAVAGRLGFASAVPALAQLLQAGDGRTVVAAAHGLAELGPAGWTRLEAEVRRARPPASAAALEALERVKSNRLHLARV
ncbi:MAG: hypothetical protein ABR559_06150 [Gemmatimonadota bacterium]